MSKHPLGPWTDTVDDNTIIVPGGVAVYQLNKNTPVTTKQGSFLVSDKKTRSGYNSGGATAKPQSASLSINHTELIRSGSISSSRRSGAVGQFNEVVTLSNVWYIVPSPAVSLTSQSALDKAFIKFTQRVAPEFSGLVFAGEFKSFKEDLEFVIATLKGNHNKVYQDLVKNLIRNKKGSKKDLLRIVSDHWLRYQFGIVPDIADIRALFDSTLKSIRSTPRKEKVSASYRDESRRNTFFSANLYYSPDTQMSVQREQKVIGKCGASLRQEFVNKDIPISERFGVGFEDFVPALYECLPFSWLADYFSNLGDIVNLLAFRRKVWENGWSVRLSDVVDRCIFQLNVPDAGVPPWVKSSAIAGSYNQKIFTFNRDPMDVDTYLPQLAVDVVPNLRQAANIAAVVASMFVKDSRRNSVGSIIRRGG